MKRKISDANEKRKQRRQENNNGDLGMDSVKKRGRQGMQKQKRWQNR